MTRRERLLATLRGQPVDRPACSFYEINGLDEDPCRENPYNIYTHPSWQPLIDLARDKTDRIVMRGAAVKNASPDPATDVTTIEADGSLFTTTTIRAGGRILRQRTRRDRDVNTVWTLEHLLKDEEDLRAWLELPEVPFDGSPDVAGVLDAEDKLADTGIVMIDVADPLCDFAQMFDLGTFTVLAMTEPELCHRAMRRLARRIYPRVEATAAALPGRLWRIVGPEYATAPYLPAELFRQYVVTYDTPMVKAIHAAGGYARIHCHGRLSGVLPHIAATGCDALDPIEPPPQGDVELSYVRKHFGSSMVLFGNLEIADIEGLPLDSFRQKVELALREGTEGSGRGFVLMPSACPYGRELAARTVRNYEAMIDCVERL